MTGFGCEDAGGSGEVVFVGNELSSACIRRYTYVKCENKSLFLTFNGLTNALKDLTESCKRLRIGVRTEKENTRSAMSAYDVYLIGKLTICRYKAWWLCRRELSSGN